VCVCVTIVPGEADLDPMETLHIPDLEGLAVGVNIFVV